jgi:hypothetical protein
MNKKDILLFVVLFLLGGIILKGVPAAIWYHDALRLRYIVGIWFLAEAGFLMFPGEARRSLPLYQLVWKYPSLRDKFAAGLALVAFFAVLFVAVWQLTENEFFWAVKLGLAIATVLVSWLAYYGICYLFGTQELRDGVMPKFVKKWLQRNKKS